MLRAAKAAKETATKLAKRARSALNRRSFEEKLKDDITNLIDYMPLGKKEKKSHQQKLSEYILSNEENEFKTIVFDISNRISMLKITQPEKVIFFNLFRTNLVKILGNNEPVINKLIQPILESLGNNVTIEEGMGSLRLSKAKKDYNKTMTSLKSRLNNTNSVAAAFLDPRRLTTRTTNNDFEEVIYSKKPTVSRATNVNQSEVNNLLAQMENEVRLNLEHSLPSVPKTKPKTTHTHRAKGGYRKIKKSRKRVYS